MDAAGKDGNDRHVMSGVNPQGCSVSSFKVPSDGNGLPTTTCGATQCAAGPRDDRHLQPLVHEEVLVVKVHPELLDRADLPRSVVETLRSGNTGTRDINN